MAADVCSELPNFGSSPRISFSNDLNKIDIVSIQDYHHKSDPNFHFDFTFCNEKRLTQEISPADELFSEGKILPIEMKIPNTKQKQKQIQIQNSEPTPPHQKPHSSTSTNAKPNVNESKTRRLKEFLCSSFELENEEKPFSKIFRQFRRSTSLNVESARAKSLIRPLQFLSRSNSTGSAFNTKENMISNIHRKQNSFKQSPVSLSRSSSSSSNAYYPYNSSKRPPLKKNRTAYSNGVRITPVLHISHSCMAFGTISLFGFGSFFFKLLKLTNKMQYSL